jgi:hypothetical protein
MEISVYEGEVGPVVGGVAGCASPETWFEGVVTVIIFGRELDLVGEMSTFARPRNCSSMKNLRGWMLEV